MRNTLIKVLVWGLAGVVAIGVHAAFIIWGMPLDTLTSVFLSLICVAAGVWGEEVALDKLGTKPPLSHHAEELLRRWNSR